MAETLQKELFTLGTFKVTPATLLLAYGVYRLVTVGFDMITGVTAAIGAYYTLA